MVDRIESRRINVTATYGAGSLTLYPLNFIPGVVRSVDIIVPKGVRGSVGVGLAYAGVPVIPNTSGELIYTDGEILSWPVDGLPIGVQWQLLVDPQGYADHMITVRMGVDEIGAPAQAPAIAQEVVPLALAAPDTTAEDTTVEQVPDELAADQEA